MAENMFITFHTPDIKGESVDSSNPDAIDVLSWNHLFSQPTAVMGAAGGGSGVMEQAHHSDFSFTKYLDAASPYLLKYCWAGKRIEKAVFSAYRSDGQDQPKKYLEITLSNVIITNIAANGGSGNPPSENISLGYEIIDYKYIRYAANGHPQGQLIVQHNLKQRKIS